ncbi:transcriptional regulator [Jiangella aurantiaca]|uniref:Transcriptional regulator n=1 Tax=Jiangella aurantiaca TaxID=2530373 RepID=A0A4R5A2A0_9ACTN|nr:transcriptional regulator [Jiangella aurantiaca]TDD64659.1 transcriptional regulator [Jiangella aurantiaca]
MADDRAKLEFFVEELGLLFEEMGERRMNGRVLGYLMLSSEPHVSTAELMRELNASAGSISAATRALSAPGFIRRVSVPGSRGHFYRADDDVWGAFLATEHRYLYKRQRLADEVMAALGDADDIVQRRMANMRDYFNWLEARHRTLGNEWEEYKRQRDAERESAE